MWRGAPFGDSLSGHRRERPPVRLGELRAHLEEVAIAEQLDAGVDASVLVGGVEGLVDAEPFRERRWALLMRTLYLAGRQHDALQAFQRARVLLRDELGSARAPSCSTSNDRSSTTSPSLRPSQATATSRGVSPPTSRLVGRGEDVVAVRDRLHEQRRVVCPPIWIRSLVAKTIGAGCRRTDVLADS